MANGDRNKITDMNLIITEYTCQFKLYQLSSINIDMVKKNYYVYIFLNT